VDGLFRLGHFEQRQASQTAGQGLKEIKK